jgi:hypothetical protein
MKRVSILFFAVAVLSLHGCGNEINSSSEDGSTVEFNQFSVPRQIIVSAAPYQTIEDALEDDKNIDWYKDKARAKACTLSYGAIELQNHLKFLGIKAAINDDGTDKRLSSIVLAVRGDPAIDDLLSESGAEIDYSALGDQGYTILPMKENLYVTGNTRVAVLYGVYRLLDFIGFAWYDSYETYVPAVAPNDKIRWKVISEVPNVKLRGFRIFGNDGITPDEFTIWLARNRFNVSAKGNQILRHKLGIKEWAGGHHLLRETFSQPGLFEEHPEWYALIHGTRRPIPSSGDYNNPSFVNEEAANYFADRMIDRLENGDLKNVDILHISPNDSRSGHFDQSQEAITLGNETDNLLFFYSIVARRFREAYEYGFLTRAVVVAGISYYLTWKPPTNYSIISELENENYLHIFCLNERDWSDVIDKNLGDRDANRMIIESLEEWHSVARLNYGIVEYYNYSIYSALGLNDFILLSENYRALTRWRTELFAYMHPLKTYPGPFRLTHIMLSKLTWKDLRSFQENMEPDQSIKKFFERRYCDYAADWRAVHELMAKSVQNAKEMFGHNSLSHCLFQDIFWSPAPYRESQIVNFIPQYLEGGTQDLPAGFSNLKTVRETFRGLKESLELQAKAKIEWEGVLSKPVPKDIRNRMEGDVSWFKATCSRYGLIAAACQFFIRTRTSEGEAEESRARMLEEINFLQSSPITQDTISPVNQRAFLSCYRKLGNIPANSY